MKSDKKKILKNWVRLWVETAHIVPQAKIIHMHQIQSTRHHKDQECSKCGKPYHD